MVKKISQNEFNEVTASEVAVIDFSATWCGPCKMMGRVLEDVDFNILKVNTDEYPEIAREYGIMSIPTLILFKDGVEVKKNIGFLSKEEIEEFIK